MTEAGVGNRRQRSIVFEVEVVNILDGLRYKVHWRSLPKVLRLWVLHMLRRALLVVSHAVGVLREVKRCGILWLLG